VQGIYDYGGLRLDPRYRINAKERCETRVAIALIIRAGILGRAKTDLERSTSARARIYINGNPV
jgi:hypothetical protein